MTRAELLKITNIVYDIGQSPEHFVDIDYETRHKEAGIYVFKKEYDGSGTSIEDSITIWNLDEEALAWLTRWAERIRKERVMYDNVLHS